MSPSVKIEFVALGSVSGVAQPSDAKKAAAKAKPPGTLVIFTNADFGFGAATRDLIGAAGEALVRKAAAAAKFKGKPSTALDILAPAGLSADRLLVVGVGPQDAAAPKPETANGEAPAAIKPVAPLTPADYAGLGGFVTGKLGRGAIATVVFDPPRSPEDAAGASAEFALGAQLRDYRFDRYKTKKKDDADENGQSEITLAVADPAAARQRGEAARRRRRGRPHRALARQ